MLSRFASFLSRPQRLNLRQFRFPRLLRIVRLRACEPRDQENRDDEWNERGVSHGLISPPANRPGKMETRDGATRSTQ